MVLFLLKREDLFKVALVCTFLAPLVLVPVPDAVIGVSFLGYLGFVALFGAARLRLDRRSTYFEAGLPIAGGQLYLVRALASLAAVWLPTATACLVILTARRNTGGPQAMALVQGAAVLTLATLLPLSVRLREAAIPGRLADCLWMWFGTVMGGVALWFVLRPLWHLACFVIAAGALFLRACYLAPPSFQLAPVEPVRERRTAGRQSLRPAWWTILRSAKPWSAIVLLILGVLIGGSIQLTIFFLFFVYQRGIYARNGIRWLEPFPLSPRTMLALTVATTIVPFMIGSALAMAFVPANSILHREPTVGFGPVYWNDQGRFFGTNVPLEYWRPAPAGKAPIIRAPWGETVQPDILPILGFSFYNPYASSKINSKQFVEWQFENATQALNGQRIPQSEYYRLMNTKSPLPPGRNREDILMLGLVLFCLLAGVSLRELALCHCVMRTTTPAVKLFVIPMFPYFLGIGVDTFYTLYQNTQVLAPFCHFLLLRLAAVLPQNLVVLALVAFTPSFFLYLLLQWQITQSETTGPLVPRTFWEGAPQ